MGYATSNFLDYFIRGVQMSNKRSHQQSSNYLFSAQSIYAQAEQRQLLDRFRRWVQSRFICTSGAHYLHNSWQSCGIACILGHGGTSHLARLKRWLFLQSRSSSQLIGSLEQPRRFLNLRRLITLALSATLLTPTLGEPSPAHAQKPHPVGDEFQVNTFTTGNQQFFNVAMDTGGNFVIVWSSASDQDGSERGIFAQRYAAKGDTQGDEFQVNTYTTGSQWFPGVVMDADGDFVIVWESGDYFQPQDGSNSGIFGQRYDRNGVAQGTEFQINTHTTDRQSKPSVAMDAAGNFVVVWQSYNQDGSDSGIFARRYNQNGIALEDEFQVNTFTTHQQYEPQIARDKNGNFVVTWTSGAFDTIGQDGSGYGIFAQLYTAAGNTQGDEFQVNTYTLGNQGYMAGSTVALDADGDFVIAWAGGNEQDGSGYGIFAQRYAADGNKQENEFQVNTYTTSFQGYPDVALDQDGDFAMVWVSYSQEEGDYFPVSGIYGQQFYNSGLSRGNEFHINTYTTFYQSAPQVAMDQEGDFVVVWQSAGQDGDGYGVFAQRYTPTLTPTLTLRKQVDNLTPVPNQPLTYTLTIDNSGLLTATNGVLSDTLPDGLQFIGPVTIEGGTGTPGIPPLIATDLTIEPNGRITVTLPVMLSEAVSVGQTLTNTAAITSLEVTTPATGSVGITITLEDGQTVYLPVVLK